MDGPNNFPKLNNYTGLTQNTAGNPSSHDAKRNRQREVVELLCKENKKINIKKRPESCMAVMSRPAKKMMQPLKIYPDEIIFKDISLNQSYEINIMVFWIIFYKWLGQEYF